ncbi:MAG: hypothetical protein O3C05_03575, partial [Proteobacteria bacterium]|nr:hypothetical protein [Pseudomonadota bacterium]
KKTTAAILHSVLYTALFSILIFFVLVFLDQRGKNGDNIFIKNINAYIEHDDDTNEGFLCINAHMQNDCNIEEELKDMHIIGMNDEDFPILDSKAHVGEYIKPGKNLEVTLRFPITSEPTYIIASHNKKLKVDKKSKSQHLRQKAVFINKN